MAKELLVEKIKKVVKVIATDVKGIKSSIGVLSSLHNDFATNSAGSNVTDALNYVLTVAKEAKSAAGASINDNSKSGTTTWSSEKIDSVVTTKVAEIVGVGTPETLDTLKEIADWIGSKETAITAINNKVPYNEVKSITDEQKGFVWQTVGIGDIDVDFVEIYNTAKA